MINEKEYLVYQHLVPKTLKRALINPKAVARKHGVGYEDLVQIGNIGLTLAIKKYNEKLSKKETYYINMIRWSVFNFLNTNNYPKLPAYSLDETISVDDEETGTLYDIIKGDELGDDEVFNIALNTIISNLNLNKREKKMFYLRAVKGLTYSKIAKEVDVSPQRVNQIIKKHKHIFKNILTNGKDLK